VLHYNQCVTGGGGKFIPGRPHSGTTVSILILYKKESVPEATSFAIYDKSAGANNKSLLIEAKNNAKESR